MKSKPIQVGQRVQYRAEFLRSIGAYTGPLGPAKGRVESIRPLGSTSLAVVAWDGNPDDVPTKVNTDNLKVI
jgi:hypothetical protein